MFIFGNMFVRICFCLHFSYISGSGCSVTPDLFVALLIGYGAAIFSWVKTKMEMENELHDFLIWINRNIVLFSYRQ